MSSIDLLRPGESPEVDWSYLPPSCASLSLWPALHDGDLLSCTSDLMARTVKLAIRVEHLADESGDEPLFDLGLTGVSSARVTTWVPWPGPHPEAKGLPRAEGFRLIAEYRSKSRWESLGWSEFESALARDRFWIMDADLASAGGRSAIRIGGHFDGPTSPGACSIVLRGEALSIARVDGRLLSPEDFFALGVRYWDDFGVSKGRDGRVS